MTTLLEVDDLHCGYGRADVIHGISLEVHAGETVCLIGPNGAGKSTLMKAIAGAVRPRSGRIVFAHRDITKAPTHERVEAGIALVPEGRGLLPSLTVEENLLLGAYVRRRDSDVRDHMRQLMDQFPVLGARRSQTATTLSGGEQKQLVIARALMSRPSMLILDEPSFGVAPLIVAAIFRTIEELRSAGMTILLVEQNASIALQVAQRGYVIESGRCALCGTATELRDSSVIQEAYLGAAT
ncbi:ABC transporter ATP-binding protein [Paraburkholderia sp. BL10I2N1]|uniref:ABC transporter ATP-binding protein n=1 Tax=unclassified Paraburkholderia TaxID=2615204 RepID=UPI00105E46C4|nr:ABC transporter ATP-binding protein [Paraburkholderia sp. BL10I2N1]TDN62363.1 amino acid/amide ABC transporter ATP-binding protein 2 (HAAT family) [Paraburkholderia sp. BL10I2N1]